VNLLCIWDIAKTSFFVLDYIPQKKLCGNAVIVESMEKSYDFTTLPTMTWKSLRLSHIPTKPTSNFLNLSIKTQKSGVHFSSLNLLKTVHFSILNDNLKGNWSFLSF